MRWLALHYCFNIKYFFSLFYSTMKVFITSHSFAILQKLSAAASHLFLKKSHTNRKITTERPLFLFSLYFLIKRLILEKLDDSIDQIKTEIKPVAQR